MLKVLHLISGGDVGGAKTHVLTLAKELQKHISVKMICFMEGAFYEEGLELALDIRVIKQNKRYDLSVVKDIVEIIKNEGIDIIHSHGARANFITRFIKNKVNIPSVTTIHSDFMLDFKGNWYKYLIFTKLNIFALKKFDYFIAVSESFKKMLCSRNFPEDNIFVVYNGIDFEEPLIIKSREEFLTEYGLENLKDKLLIGMLARLHPVKGHHILLEAFENIIRENKLIHLLIAGDGEERKKLEEMAQKLNIEDNVHFIGFVENGFNFINAIDINVLTSFSESFPYVLLEGAKLRKPTVASNVGGIPMLIKDGLNGFLFTAGKADELENKLQQLINDEEKRKYFGNNLYEYAKENYSLSNLAHSHIEIYKELLRKFN